MIPIDNIVFGTDGWRGIIADDFTFNNVRRCTQGMAEYLKQTGLAERGILIGYDTRFASSDFAQAAAKVMLNNGLTTYVCSQATPTPTVSFGVPWLQTGGAIVITASHNPPQWNGFKVKTAAGASAPPEVINEIEHRTNRTKGPMAKQPQATSLGTLVSIDLTPAYYAHLASLVDINSIKEAGLNIAIDSMFGSAAGYIAHLLAGGKTRIQEINCLQNPIFPGIKQPEPTANNLHQLSALVRDTKADVGLATDGDGDRLGIVDDKGNYITPSQVLTLLAFYLLEIRGERGPIVKTVAASNMIYRLGEVYHVPVYETPVGFRHIAPLMINENALIGGEESGGYGFRGHVPERDGILAGLYFLDLMNKTQKTPSALVELLHHTVGPHYFQRLDIQFSALSRPEITKRLAEAQPTHINNIPVRAKDMLDGFRFKLADGSWILFRFSGTEPLLRIYAESDTPEKAGLLTEIGRSLALR